MDVTGLNDEQIAEKVKEAYFLWKEIEKEFMERMEDPDFKREQDEKTRQRQQKDERLQNDDE